MKRDTPFSNDVDWFEYPAARIFSIAASVKFWYWADSVGGMSMNRMFGFFPMAPKTA